MRILVVEDEPKTGDYLKRGLVEAGFVVDLVRDGRRVRTLLRRLRAKVDDGFEPKLIRTVRGMGYVLENPDCP